MQQLNLAFVEQRGERRHFTATGAAKNMRIARAIAEIGRKLEEEEIECDAKAQFDITFGTLLVYLRLISTSPAPPSRNPAPPPLRFSPPPPPPCCTAST